MISIIQAIYIILVAYLAFYSAFWLISTLVGMSYQSPKTKSEKDNPEMLIVLPAYKPSLIFEEVLASLDRAIGDRNIKVLVLLQEADVRFASIAKSLGFITEEKKFSHLPGNSYHHALRHVTGHIKYMESVGFSPEFVMLLDKDNIIDEDFFNNIDKRIYTEYDVIQGRRVALNSNSSTSFFDTVTEGLNDLMFRAAGSMFNDTVEISGSAALIRTPLFIEGIDRLNPKAPGFDKNFMVNVLTTDIPHRMTYLPQCMIMEEKTTSISAHNPQRLRWFGEQYFNALFSFKPLLGTWLTKGKWNAFWYFLVLYRPPRSIHMILLPIILMAELAVLILTGVMSSTITIVALSTAAIVISAWLTLHHLRSTGSGYKYFMKLPSLAFNNIFNAARSLKSENRGKFIHTDHQL